MRFNFLVIALIGTSVLFAEEEEDGLSYSDQPQSSFYQSMDFSDAKLTVEGSSQTWKTKKGNVDIEIGADNVDQFSRWKQEREKENPTQSKQRKKKENNSKKKDEEQEKDDGPTVHAKFSWGPK